MDMELSQNFLRAKSPCASGFRWFVRNRHDGNDYQRVLDALVTDGRVEDARWLMQQFGPTDAVLEVEHLESEALVFAGTVVVHGEVRVPGLLAVGRTLQAGAGIHAGRIEAGQDLHSGGAIFCAGPLQAGGLAKAAWSVDVQGELRCEDVRAGWELRCAADLRLAGGAQAGQDIEVQGAIHCGKGLRAGGSIRAQGLIKLGHGLHAGADVHGGNHIEAGWGLRALGDIRAACSIRAGETLHAEGEIEAGPGYGIYAGMNVQQDAWPSCAWVHAARQPPSLLSGWWAGGVAPA